MQVPTLSTQHRTAVLSSIDVVATVRPSDLRLPTPCSAWNLRDLLAHMTAQHRGFAAAARGHGADPAAWNADALVDAVTRDPSGTYAEAAHDVLEAFAADGVDEAPFALPEFGPDAVAPGATAMGFHFVDYVVHGWDVAVTIGTPFTLPDDVLDAVLPIAMDVPDGDFRSAPASPFGRTIEAAAGGTLDRVLRHLGRAPEWTQPYSTVTGA